MSGDDSSRSSNVSWDDACPRFDPLSQPHSGRRVDRIQDRCDELQDVRCPIEEISRRHRSGDRRETGPESDFHLPGSSRHTLIAHPLGNGVGEPHQFPTHLARGVLVVRVGLLVPDRLRLALGIDRAIVRSDRERCEVSSEIRTDRRGQHREVDVAEILHGGDAEPLQFLQRRGPHTPESLHR